MGHSLELLPLLRFIRKNVQGFANAGSCKRRGGGRVDKGARMIHEIVAKDAAPSDERAG